MDKISLAMDLNTLADVVVPFYTVAVLVVLFMFNKASVDHNSKKIYTFEPALNAGQKRKFTLADFAGVWKHETADALEAWLIVHRKNFAVRLIASSMFFKQRNLFEFNEDYTTFSMTKDFGKDVMPYRVENVPIAEDIKTAVDTKIPGDDGKGHHFMKAAFDKETGTFHIILTEGPHVADGCVNHMARTINPKNPDIMNAVRRIS